MRYKIPNESVGSFNFFRTTLPTAFRLFLDAMQSTELNMTSTTTTTTFSSYKNTCLKHYVSILSTALPETTTPDEPVMFVFLFFGWIEVFMLLKTFCAAFSAVWYLFNIKLAHYCSVGALIHKHLLGKWLICPNSLVHKT